MKPMNLLRAAALSGLAFMGSAQAAIPIWLALLQRDGQDRQAKAGLTRARQRLLDQADALLARHHIARVAADPARHVGDAQPGGSARFAYWRWHGAPRIYYSDYNAEALDTIATAVRAGPADAWVVFDNTAAGFAIPNAAALQARLR